MSDFHKNHIKKGEVNVKDNDHITEKYWRSTHQEFNLNFSLRKEILAMFHNLQNYASHLIFQRIGKYDFKIYVRVKTTEKYVTSISIYR